MDRHVFIVFIQINTEGHVWNRSILQTSLPNECDIRYYYNNLCDLQGATIIINTHKVPASFNEKLLPVPQERAPTQFPANDLMTDASDSDKRTQYATFIKQVCDMETSRAALGVFASHVVEPPPSEVSAPSCHKARAWVNELLRSLNADDVYAASTADDELVISYTDDNIPLGWVVTPVASSHRAMKGSRIILDAEIGMKWERLLGSDLYPDLVVSRRISSANWLFQHAKSDALVKTTLDWYLACQDATIQNGISGWILQADREISALFATFKRIKINEKLITEPSFESRNPVFILLSNVETRLLRSALENTDIIPMSHDIFQRYMNYMFRANSISKDIYAVEAVNVIFQRWVRGKMGFKADVDPLIESWCESWKYIMRGQPTVERVYHFLHTLDAWDPIEVLKFPTSVRTSVANEWINVFIDAMMIEDDKSRVRTTNLHDRVKEWCSRYLPMHIFPTSFTPMTVGPALTRRGYNSVKGKEGRFVRGLRYRNPDMELNTVTTATIASTTATTANGTTTIATASVLSVGEGDGNRIEHFFASSTTLHEINLGSI